MTSQAGPAGDGWRAAAPEICVAAVLVAVAAATGYVAAGLPGAAAVVIGAAVVALVVMRAITPLGTPPGDVRVTDAEAVPVTFTGYWRRRAGLVDGTQSLAAYDAVLRGTLQHLLAARLAERHGISLHDDPTPHGGCCARARATTPCGTGWTRHARRPRRGSSRASRPGPWPGSSTDWSTCERPHPHSRPDRRAVRRRAK